MTSLSLSRRFLFALIPAALLPIPAKAEPPVKDGWRPMRELSYDPPKPVIVYCPATSSIQSVIYSERDLRLMHWHSKWDAEEGWPYAKPLEDAPTHFIPIPDLPEKPNPYFVKEDAHV